MATDQSFSLAAGDSGSGQTEAQQMLDSFWPKVMDDIRKLTTNDFKSQELPLARIKKIMKLDDDVKVMMISAEAPVLFAKAAEIFITEISLRAWIHTEDNKRRTLQRNDIAMAISKYDQFDFLIDIVPREELKPPPKRSNHSSNQSITLSDAAATVPADQVQYILQQAGLQQHATGQPIQILQTGNGLTAAPAGFSLAQQLLQIPAGHIQATADGSTGTAAASGQVIQLAGQPGTSGQAGGQHLQIVHQMNGDVSQIPISLNQQQLQMIRMQLQGQTGIPATQPILIQAPAQSAAAQYQLATQSGQFFLQTGGASGPQAQTVDAQETQSEVDETE